jgi:hypothetical protein
MLLAAVLTQAAEEKTPLERFQQAAAQYDIRLEDAARSKLAFVPKPLLHWDNPARTAEDGAVFVWLKDGRPEVVGSIFTYKLTNVRTKHEFQSLAAGPLSARYEGRVVWKPRAAGVTFRPVPEAPTPAESDRLRLVQMKALARDFDARLIDLKGETNELRLMPQPLYRYETDGKTVLDGAIFSFALGTDPEALLLIEARRSEGDWQWQYAFARFHFAELRARYKAQDVWRIEADPSQLNTKIGDPAHLEKPYVTYHVD